MSKLTQHWQLRWDSQSPHGVMALGALTLSWIINPLRSGRKPQTLPENAPLTRAALRGSRTQPLLPTFRPAGDENPGSLGSVPITWAFVIQFQGKSVCSTRPRAIPSAPPPPSQSPVLLLQGTATTWPWAGLWPSTTGPTSPRCCRTGGSGASLSTAPRTWA